MTNLLHSLPPSLPPFLPPSLKSARVVKSLEAYDLLDDVGGLPLVQLDVEDVFWAVLEDLDLEAAGTEGGREEGGERSGFTKSFLYRRHLLTLPLSLPFLGGGDGVPTPKVIGRTRSNSTTMALAEQVIHWEGEDGGKKAGWDMMGVEEREKMENFERLIDDPLSLSSAHFLQALAERRAARQSSNMSASAGGGGGGGGDFEKEGAQEGKEDKDFVV
jgi:hypothetical protein